jgi:hypothetical protein
MVTRDSNSHLPDLLPVMDSNHQFWKRALFLLGYRPYLYFLEVIG